MQGVAQRTWSIPRIGKELLGDRWHPSLLSYLYPSLTLRSKIAVSLIFVLLLTGLGQARFYLPDNPVPITLQTFGVLITGGILGWRWGFLSIIMWYLLGIAGLPMFQGGGSGWAYVSGGVSDPETGARYLTGGYLLGFMLATWMVGILSQRGWTHSRVLWPMLLSNLMIYLPGLLFLAIFSNAITLSNMFGIGMYPFIPGDLVKIMGASILTGALWKYADHRSDRRH